MTFKKLVLITAMASALGALYGCSDGDETSILIEGDTNGGGGDTDGGDVAVSENCPEWASAKNKDDDGNDVCALPSTIMEDRTLSSNIVWYLEDRVTVGNGNREMSATQGELASGVAVADVTLTIDAGTAIKGKKGTFANLLITRGSKIMAEGTADAPIVFSSDDADDTGSGEWGGLILHGYAPHNECPTAADSACNIDAEGESGFAAGYDADDSSGVLKYVVVTEGGYEFAPGDEINGISLVGVGAGTEVDYVQVNSNSDDGIEFFGGTVNMKHVVLTNNLDDSVDWDEGFSGNLQYVLVVQNTPDTFGTLIEADTFGSDAFLSQPTILNATFVAKSGESSPPALFNFKAGTGGYVFNSILTADLDSTIYQACIFVNGGDAQGEQNTHLVVEDSILDCGLNGIGGYNGETETVSETGFALTLMGVATVDPALDDNYVPGAAEASLAGPIDFVALMGTYADLSADPEYLDATDYMGAVDPDATSLWFEGWTIEGSL
ncbi:hypothetical protein RM530_13165 [Algiphilus sp. W345]|uniref:Multidrug transporter n=1 Tax=Banduia mediterranea TaxID=3075609 RepID=A0ABU2WKB8_9GAMM|nr:hypothetical protein [Algiphilus sp. W345]MDT0498307.1 hypothetical protein [Algiphilus sp. W345]